MKDKTIYTCSQRKLKRQFNIPEHMEILEIVPNVPRYRRGLILHEPAFRIVAQDPSAEPEPVKSPWYKRFFGVH